MVMARREGRTLRLPDAKAGARPVALSSIVLALLADAPRTSRFVIPTTRAKRRWRHGPQPCVGGRLQGREDRGPALHDLRHAFATRGAGLGASAVVLRDALGHKTYANDLADMSAGNDPVRELAERIGAQIEAVRGAKEGAEVLPLRRKRGQKDA